MSHNHGQSSLKNLLHNYGKHHKTHIMTTRQGGQVALYDDAEDTYNPQEITVLPTTPSSNSIVDLDGEIATNIMNKLPLKEIWHNCRSILNDSKKSLIN